MADSSTHMQPGTVFLVGAGPGHPGLITRWGYDLLQQCNAVAYDALIPMELISSLPESVEKYYVGKRAGKHSLPQPQINELLVTLAKRGLRVVRLKGGDPFVFGRIGEEATHLSAAGINVVMVPGVTAASAAAAMSGFSLTTRQESSWIFIATGHPAENSSTPVPWDQVAGLPGGTLVVYMGIARLKSIVEQLLASGMASETPAVVVQAASTGLQQSVHAPLNQIDDQCRRQNLKPPALVIIGESVRGHLNNPERAEGALAGKNILLTGPARTTGPVCAALREAGAEPVPYPTVIHRGCDDGKGWSLLLETIDKGATCLFQDEFVVGKFFEKLMLRGHDARDLARFNMVVVGKDTVDVLASYGIRADAVAADLEAGSLAACLKDSFSTADLPLVWVHRNPGPSFPEDGISHLCNELIPLAVETASAAEWDSRLKDGLLADPPDFVVFTGNSEVVGFVELLGKEAASDLTGRSCVVAVNEAVVESLKQYGLSCDLAFNASDTGNLVSALEAYLQQDQG